MDSVNPTVPRERQRPYKFVFAFHTFRFNIRTNRRIVMLKPNGKNNVNPYHMMSVASASIILIWIEWKISILFIKSKKKNCEKRSGRSSVNDICFNKIKFLKLLPKCKSVNPLQRSYLNTLTRPIACTHW